MKTRVIQNEPGEPPSDTRITGRGPGSLIRRHPVITFFVLAYALTWAPLPFGIFNAGGPLLAAVITAAVTRRRAGLRELGSRLIRWRVGWGWYAVAVGLPLAAHLITVSVNLMLGAPAPSLAQFTPWYTVLLVFAVRLINPLNGALGEEPGWRGFALPHLQATRPPLVATAMLAGLVALWHTPLLLPKFGVRPFDLVGVVAITFFFCWLFNRTGGSVVVPLAAHAAEGSINTADFWGGTSAAADTRARVLYVLVWCAIAIGLLVFDATRWHRPAPASATAPPAPRTRQRAPAVEAAGPGRVSPGALSRTGMPAPGGNAGRGRWVTRPRVFLAVPALLAGVLLVAGTAAPAVAGTGPQAAGPHVARPYRVKELRVVSGPSPFPAGCPGARFDNAHVAGYETEPMITVNPANPRNLVATWKQDTGPAAARTDLVASSLDGGKTWARRMIPGLTKCTGGTADATSDPWISAAGDGSVYLSGVPGDLSGLPPPITVVASRSRNGGRTWPAPVTVAPPRPGNDTDRITGSPTLPAHAYLAWANFTGVVPRTNTLEFSRTTNSGATWSPPVLIDQPGRFAIDLAPRILVLPGGTLLAVFLRADFRLGLNQLYAARSRDEGRTWQPPVLADAIPLTSPPIDPGTGAELPSGFPSAAAAPDGGVYIAFEDNTSAASGGIGIVRSRDGGRTWTTGTLSGVTAYAFEPAVAVDSHGTVGVTWYDMRNDRPGDNALTADVWFAHSGDHGATWRQTHLAGPTGLRPADLPVSNYVGEYQGLAALRGRGFAAIFTLATPQARNGPTDIFFARVAPG